MNRRWLILLGFLTVAAVVMTAAWLFGPSALAPAPSPTVSPTSSPSPNPTASPVSATPAWPTADQTKAYAGPAAGSPRLVAIRTGTHPGYDRIAFDFDGPAAPGYTIKYVPQITRDGSGAAVTLTGAAFLQVVFTPAAAHDMNGAVTVSPVPTNPVNTSFTALKSYVMSGDFEGYVSFGLGQQSKAGFKVGQTSAAGNRWTVYVDVPR